MVEDLYLGRGIKISSPKFLAVFSLSFVLQYMSSFIEIQFLNPSILSAIAFLVSCILIATFCFDIATKTLILSSLSLAFLKFSTTLIISGALTLLFRAENEMPATLPISLIQKMATELLFFFAVAILLQLQNRYSNNIKTDKSSALLLFFPPLSLFIIIVFIISSYKINPENALGYIFVIASLLLLIANIFLFVVYEKTVKILKKNGEYAIAARQEALELSHYEELKRNKEASDKLVHEIKNHLSTVKALARDGNSTEISDYVESVLSDGDFEYSKEYSRNKLVNIIISRYAQLSKASGIVFDADIRDVSFDGLKESELTSLLDNILKNAYEGALRSFEKRIAIRIELKNEIVLKIYAENSCDEAPAFCGNTLISSKPDKKSHGYGTKIITKTAESHGGTASFSFDEEEKLFKCTVVMLR